MQQCKRAPVSTSALDLACGPERARDGLTVVNVIEVLVRIMGIVDDERAAQAVAVLRRYVAVVPERACARCPTVVSYRVLRIPVCPGLAVPGRGARTCLAGSVEVVEEGVARDDGALRDERRAVRPGGRVLE